MGEPKFKHLIDELKPPQCQACLSVGRKMIVIGELAELYTNLISGCTLHLSACADVQICWECHALLRKAQSFQLRVRKAHEIMTAGQNQLSGSLSSLTTIVISESLPNTILLDDSTYIHTAVKNETCGVQTDNSCHDNVEDQIDDNFCHIDNHTDIVKNESYFVESDNMYHDDGGLYQVNDNFCGIDDNSRCKYDIKTDRDSKSSRKVLSNENNMSKPNETENCKQKKCNRWARKRILQNKKSKYKILEHKEINVKTTFRKVRMDCMEIYKQVKKEKHRNYKKQRYKCESCGIGFKNESSLATHRNFHESSKYICDICKTGFSRKSALSTHIKDHSYKYMCSLCHFTCYRKRERIKHVETDHMAVFQCLKCKLCFGTRGDFSAHFKEWHEKYICHYCGVSFKMRYCIQEHIRKQHSPLKCKHCAKTFGRYNGLWLHMKTTHAPAASPAYCVECDKRYVDVYRYRWHLANSARHRPKKTIRIPCPACDKVFTKKIYMRDHYNLVHLKEYKYRCEKCDKNFLRNADLVKHTRRVHEGILPPRDKMCCVCGKGFTTNKILSNHARTHTGERPFACARCPARFAQRSALTGHERAIHHQ